VLGDCDTHGMRMRSVQVVLALVLWLGGAIAPFSASAKREDSFSYPFTRVWTTAVRLLRVDFECPITEKDKDEGYFFFEYKDHDKTYPGSVELVTTKTAGVERVRVVIQVPAMPSYVESMMLDRLGRKLIEDFGIPTTPTPAPAPIKPAPGNGPAGNENPDSKPKPKVGSNSSSSSSQEPPRTGQKPAS
jgi:hypothetical protein